jgi:hypothetical protein
MVEWLSVVMGERELESNRSLLVVISENGGSQMVVDAVAEDLSNAVAGSVLKLLLP